MELPRILEWVCTGAFALSGVLSARDSKADLDVFGVVVVGVVTAIGGGTIRDVLLDVEVFWLTRPDMLYWALAVSVVGFFGARLHSHRLDTSVQVLDAIGLALFTVYGANKALQLDASWLSCIFMGVITGVGGGMMRDVCTAQIPLVMRKEIYATAALVGAGCVVAFPSPQGQWLGVGACFLLRLAAIRWQLSITARGW